MRSAPAVWDEEGPTMMGPIMSESPSVLCLAMAHIRRPLLKAAASAESLHAGFHSRFLQRHSNGMRMNRSSASMSLLYQNRGTRERAKGICNKGEGKRKTHPVRRPKMFAAGPHVPAGFKKQSRCFCRFVRRCSYAAPQDRHLQQNPPATWDWGILQPVAQLPAKRVRKRIFWFSPWALPPAHAGHLL